MVSITRMAYASGNRGPIYSADMGISQDISFTSDNFYHYDQYSSDFGHASLDTTQIRKLRP